MWKAFAICGVWGTVAYVASLEPMACIVMGICATIATAMISEA